VKVQWWSVYLMAGVAALAAYLAIPAGIPQAIAYEAVGLSGVVAILAGVRLHRPAKPGPWYLMAIGQFSWVTGDCLYSWYREVEHVSPFPSAADGLYLAAYPMLGCGILALIHVRQRRLDVPGLIDSAIVTIGVGLLSWLVLAKPIVSSAEPVLTRLVGVAYPAGDILLLGLLVRLVTAPGARTASFRLLTGAVAALLMADTAYAVFSANSAYDGGAVDLLWLGSYVLWGVAALHPSMRSLSEPGTQEAMPFTGRRLVALTLAVLIAPGALGAELLFQLSLDAWPVFIASVALFSLVVARMYAAIREVVAASSKRDQLQRELAHQAAYDSLTGLANRAHLLGLIESALHRAQRAGVQLGLLCIDLDRFKVVNDAFGHHAGDEVLRVVADRMRRVVRAGDTVGRLSGDEFVILIEPLDEASEVMLLGERLIAAIAAPIPLAGRDVTVGVSIGAALSSDGSTDADELLHRADAAAYLAKTAGRGRVEVFDEALREQLESRADLESAIRSGLAADEFLLHYQPVLDLSTGRILGYEALIRWQRPGHGLLLPEVFIPTAEQSVLVCDIGRWVLHQATRQLAQWRQADPQGADVTVAVNVSGRHLATPAIVDDVAEALRESGLPASALVVEITETVLVDRFSTAPQLEAMRELGVGISIDDFGTGYTSIGQLQHLHVDTLKIDKSFINSAGPGALDLIKLMINAAHAFGLKVVAEGVEDPEQLRTLRELTCDSGQGYLFARPQPASALPPGTDLGLSAREFAALSG
jgi:diguanylate cyclase (GGDEF)-like protein